ncbi:hypothetical protein [Desulfoluna butyratoxydans]|uniref:Uncharacterized protein n=1 Tax=Desulfoluna butyratoxydans TaxID=231438 RepID=A0A4U8YSX8_9BACT|nr:hypothetical protein [Desulfoluna butyratoxydans]VFQ44403.1 hypothetical protein MSL71_20520 [Desulfoluna butyratoxydans]
MSEVLKNINQVHRYLTEQGCRVSYGKVKTDLIDKRAVPRRRGGGWSVQSVTQYAAAFLEKTIDEAPEADRPTEEPQGGAATAKAQADADLKNIQAARARFNLEKELGRHVETATVETELGERAKAFKLGLEKWGLDNGEMVASLFGGEETSARDLLAALGTPDTPEAIQAIIDFSLSRQPRWVRLWRKSIEDFLDAYATGTWWTEEMQAAWELFDESRDKEVSCG